MLIPCQLIRASVPRPPTREDACVASLLLLFLQALLDLRDLPG